MNKLVTLTCAEMEYLLDKVDSDLKYNRTILEKRALESLGAKLKTEPSSQEVSSDSVKAIIPQK